MFDSIQGCNDLIKSLIEVTGSYQDAMFLYLTILMSENVEIGVSENLYKNLTSGSQNFNIISVFKPKDAGIVEICVINSYDTFSSGCVSMNVSSEISSHNNLAISTYKKNESGEWQITKKNRISNPSSKETIWKKY